jgi:hypothetical protein
MRNEHSREHCSTLGVVQMAVVDQLVLDAGYLCALAHYTCVGSSTRQRSAATAQGALSTRRTGACGASARDLGNLGFAEISMHASHHSTWFNSAGREWNHVRRRVDRVVLPAIYRHTLQPRKSLARLPELGVSRIQRGGRNRDFTGPLCKGGCSVSAPTLALTGAQKRKVVVRLADSAVATAYVSVAFGLLLTFSPVSFPRIIVQSWWSGRLTIAMLVFTLLFDLFLYLRVAHLRSAKLGILAPVCLGSLPVIIVVGLTSLLQVAISLMLSGYIPNVEARVSEEIVTHTYFQLVSAIFIPFLVIRLLEQFKTTKSEGRRLSTPLPASRKSLGKV